MIDIESENEIKRKICVITMTCNRPDYIVRSFESLYKRAGTEFDHYVFDDASDDETTNVLVTLQEKYKFNLVRNKKRLGIFKNFHKNIRQIPATYDYYVKLDSDIELLSDNLFAEMLEVFGFHSAICGTTPKVEGVYNAQRPEDKCGAVQFFNGHAVRINAPVVYGCCLMFTKKVFDSFPRMTDIQLDESKDKWAIDSKLYEHSLRFGKFIVIEDLSVYHIDNTYGQRKHDMHYFTARNRWGTIDKDEVWFMRLSRDIYPKFLDRSILSLLRQSSADNYESFLRACNSALTHGLTEESIKKNDTMNLIRAVAETIKEPVMTVFKISSPQNFVKSKNMTKNEVRYYEKTPDWVKKDPGVVVESEEMTVAKAHTLLYKEPSNLVQKEARRAREDEIDDTRREEGLQQDNGRTDAEDINN